MISYHMTDLRGSAAPFAALVALLAATAPAMAAPGVGATPLSTEGSEILDANGQPVRILSVGLWPESGASDKTATIAQAGFIAIRADHNIRWMYERTGNAIFDGSDQAHHLRRSDERTTVVCRDDSDLGLSRQERTCLRLDR